MNLLRLVWIKELLLSKGLPYSRTVIIMGEVSPAQGNTFFKARLTFEGISQASFPSWIVTLKRHGQHQKAVTFLKIL